MLVRGDGLAASMSHYMIDIVSLPRPRSRRAAAVALIHQHLSRSD